MRQNPNQHRNSANQQIYSNSNNSLARKDSKKLFEYEINFLKTTDPSTNINFVKMINNA